ncbi:MAG: dihydrofolate reductase [Chloroflexota bacterium]
MPSPYQGEGISLIVSILVAMSENRGIGVNNRLPWRLPADMKRFRRLTMGHHLIMGRKTFESIGKPLPGRQMIVITRNTRYRPNGCQIAHSLDQALALAENRGETEVFIIGGADMFSQALEVAERIYLTRVHAFVDADIFFPKFDEDNWVVRASEYHPADEHNEYAFTSQVLDRKP